MTPRATPFQRDYERMMRFIEAEAPRVAVADEALMRRINTRDASRSDNERVHTSGTTDPTGEEAARRCEAQEAREDYRDVAILRVWEALKAARQATDNVIRGEPIESLGGLTCISKDCANYASPHTRPDTGDVINDLCDACWRKLCTKCYVRPIDQYRATCFTCYQRTLRNGEAA